MIFLTKIALIFVLMVSFFGHAEETSIQICYRADYNLRNTCGVKTPAQINADLATLGADARVRYLEAIDDAKVRNLAIARYAFDNIKKVTLSELESLANAVKRLDISPMLPPPAEVFNDPKVLFSKEMDDLFAQDDAFGDSETKLAIYRKYYFIHVHSPSEASQWMASAKRVGTDQTAGYFLRDVLKQRLKSGEPIESVGPYLEAFWQAPDGIYDNVGALLEELAKVRANSIFAEYRLFSPEEVIRLAKYYGPSNSGRGLLVSQSIPLAGEFQNQEGLAEYEKRNGELTPNRMTALLEAMNGSADYGTTSWNLICHYYELRAHQISVDQALAWSIQTDSSVFHDSTLESYVKNRDDLSVPDLIRIQAALKENSYESKTILDEAMARAKQRM
jgi:hypothetical protein